MKKLMTVLASAATALFAFGDGETPSFEQHGADFEAAGFVAGEAFLAGKADDGTSGGQNNKYWYSTSEDIGSISNYEGSASSNVPDMFNGQVNKKYLHIDTSSPLFRSALPYEGTGANVPTVDIGGGIYLDTLVQFTAADDAFQTDLDTGDKIAISYVEHEDDDTTADVNEAWTNFVIRAGAKVEGQFGQENYLAAVPAGFEKDAWHRLTVRTIKDVGDGQVGFVIYLDGDMTKTLNFTNEVNTGFTATSLNSTAKGFYDNHALYPSAVASAATGGTTISAASFSGTGALDDVVFTATKPSFITEADQVTIKWDADITGIEIAGVAATQGEIEAGQKTIVLDGPVTIKITAITQGKEARFETSGSGVWNGTSYSDLAAGDTVTITSIVPAFEIGGVRYTADELDDVIEAAAKGTTTSPATIKLLADSNKVFAFAQGVIVLDLAGQNIESVGGEFSVGNTGATLTITNSGAEASIKVPSDNGEGVAGTGAVLTIAGFTTIQAATFDGVVATMADGEETFANQFMLITGGKFLDASYNPEDASSFYLAACVAQGLSYTKVGNYVQIGEGGGQQGGYPTYIEEIEDATVKAAYEAKYDTWKGTYGADAESAFGTAFLLNIAPNAADQTLEPASITIADGKVVITANKDLGAVNGKVYVKTAATLAGLKTAEWAAATLDETTKAINVTQGSTDTAGFYQIKVDF